MALLLYSRKNINFENYPAHCQNDKITPVSMTDLLTDAKEFSISLLCGNSKWLEGRKGALGCHLSSSVKFQLVQTL